MLSRQDVRTRSTRCGGPAGWSPRCTSGPGPRSSGCDDRRPRPGGARGAGASRRQSNFLGYHGFPAVICTSPNAMIVHGIPGDYRLEEGDILSVDCGAIIEGYHGDAAYTVAVGDVGADAERLIEVTEDSLWAGIDRDEAGNRLHDIGRGRADGRRRRRGSAWCGSTSATPSAPPCTRIPRSPTTGRERPAEAEGRHRLRHRADGQRRQAGRPPSSTTAGAW